MRGARPWPKGAREPVDTRRLAALFLGAVLIKLAFMWHLEGRVYPDVTRAINFGYALDRQILSIHTDFIRNKTFLGPSLWFHVHQSLGLTGVMLFNLLAFGLLFLTQYRLGRTRYEERSIVVALLLFAFYVGTNRNVAAGEPDDNLAALCFSLGILVYLDAKKPAYASLLMGLGFLFKFWVAVFLAGFGVYLLTRKRWRELLTVAAGSVVPFLVINGADGFESLRGLLASQDMQQGYSSWGSVGFKMLSTGLAPSVLIAAYVWLHDRSEQNTLFFFVSSAYAAYAVVQRDAFAASYVMMLCLMFSSFLIAEFMSRRLGARGLAAACALYIVLSSAITYHNLYEDTRPVVLRTNESAIRRMFP
jgi:hypothetical protein